MNKFEPRIVAFIDILGLSSAVTDGNASRRFANAIDAILSPIVRKREEPWLVLPHVVSGEEIEIELSLPVAARSCITTISDAILLSVPYGPRCTEEERLRRIFGCLRAVYGIQNSLLALGLRTRGGISFGGLIHKAHLVVGDGLVKAYRLETEVAIYPRVVIDKEIIRTLVEGSMPEMVYFRNRVAHIVRQDADGSYFVDYLSIDPVIGGTRMGQHIERIIRDVQLELHASPALRVEQKLRWMLNYFTVVNRGLIEKGDHRTSHAEPYFSEVYYRNDETLRTYVASLKAGALP